jgi:hypothetical protein
MIQLRDRIPPASWTIVMACGVVSIDLSAVRQPAPSAILLWFTAGVWLLLVAVLGVPLVYQRDRIQRATRSPVTLAGVAATAVLGVRFALSDQRVSAAALPRGGGDRLGAVVAAGSVALEDPDRRDLLRRRRGDRWPGPAQCHAGRRQVTGVSGIISFGRVSTWVATAVALVVFAGLFRHIHPARRADGRTETVRGRRAYSASGKDHYDGT